MDPNDRAELQAAKTPEPSPKPSPTDREVLEFLAWRYDRLQMLFQFTLGGLIILAAAVNLFMLKQMRLVRVQLEPQREVVRRQVAEFQKKDDILIRSFVARLQEFGATHPDFLPILHHYQPHLDAYFLPAAQKAAPAPASTPAPAATNR